MSRSLSRWHGDAVAPGSKLVHFVRHGEAAHNAAVRERGTVEEYKSWEWMDSRLTPRGREQAMSLREAKIWEHADAVVVSTLSRAIETGLLAQPTVRGI
jgi:broad specificity phosphatase PhoE